MAATGLWSREDMLSERGVDIRMDGRVEGVRCVCTNASVSLVEAFTTSTMPKVRAITYDVISWKNNSKTKNIQN